MNDEQGILAERLRQQINRSDYSRAACMATDHPNLVLIKGEALFRQGWYGQARQCFLTAEESATSDDAQYEARMWRGLVESQQTGERTACLDAIGRFDKVAGELPLARCHILARRFKLKASLLDFTPAKDDPNRLVVAHHELLDWSHNLSEIDDRISIIDDVLAFASSACCNDSKLLSRGFEEVHTIYSSVGIDQREWLDRIVTRCQAKVDAKHLDNPMEIRQCFERSRTILGDAFAPVEAAHTYLDCANALRHAGFDCQVEYENCIAVFRNLDYPVGVFSCHLSLGAIHSECGNVELAKLHYRTAGDLAASMDYPSGELEAIYGMLYATIVGNEHEEAIATIQRIESLATSKVALEIAHMRISKAWADASNFEQAVIYTRRAIYSFADDVQPSAAFGHLVDYLNADRKYREAMRQSRIGARIDCRMGRPGDRIKKIQAYAYSAGLLAISAQSVKEIDSAKSRMARALLISGRFCDKSNVSWEQRTDHLELGAELLLLFNRLDLAIDAFEDACAAAEHKIAPLHRQRLETQIASLYHRVWEAQRTIEPLVASERHLIIAIQLADELGLVLRSAYLRRLSAQGWFHRGRLSTGEKRQSCWSHACERLDELLTGWSAPSVRPINIGAQIDIRKEALEIARERQEAVGFAIPFYSLTKPANAQERIFAWLQTKKMPEIAESPYWCQFLSLREDYWKPRMNLEEAGSLLKLLANPTSRVLLADMFVESSIVTVVLISSDQSGSPIHEINVNFEQIEAAVNLFCSEENRTGQFSDSDVTLLFNSVKGVTELLVSKTKPGDVICLNPDGILHLVPWAALIIDGRPLGSRNTVTFLPASTMLRRLAKFPRRSGKLLDQCLVVGNPNEDLPLAQMEAEQVARAVGVEPICGSSATVSQVLKRLSNSTIFHFAGQVKLDHADPLRCGIMLADEKLTGVDFLRHVKSPPQLIVLSGCEAGKLVGEFKSSPLTEFSRAQLAAGCQTVVASQRRINHASLSDLMAEFYRNLLAGASVAKALHMAVTQRSRLWPSLYNCASFSLFGDWR